MGFELIKELFGYCGGWAAETTSQIQIDYSDIFSVSQYQ